MIFSVVIRNFELRRLGIWSKHQFRSKDSIPEATGDAEAVLVVGKVVLEVVFLEFLVV